jgi:hypothetical protein
LFAHCQYQIIYEVFYVFVFADRLIIPDYRCGVYFSFRKSEGFYFVVGVTLLYNTKIHYLNNVVFCLPAGFLEKKYRCKD